MAAWRRLLGLLSWSPIFQSSHCTSHHQAPVDIIYRCWTFNSLWPPFAIWRGSAGPDLPGIAMWRSWRAPPHDDQACLPGLMPHCQISFWTVHLTKVMDCFCGQMEVRRGGLAMEGIIYNMNIDGFVQERRNSSALAMELRLSCTNPSICVLCPYTCGAFLYNCCQKGCYGNMTTTMIWLTGLNLLMPSSMMILLWWAQVYGI